MSNKFDVLDRIVPIEEQIKNLEEAIAEDEARGPRTPGFYGRWIHEDVLRHSRQNLERLRKQVE